MKLKLEALFEKINERDMSRESLEAYRDELVRLYGRMCLEMAELRKEEARYFLQEKKETDVATRRAWDNTTSGQRLIELRYYTKATEKLISSSKDRIYRLL